MAYAIAIILMIVMVVFIYSALTLSSEISREEEYKEAEEEVKDNENN